MCTVAFPKTGNIVFCKYSTFRCGYLHKFHCRKYFWNKHTCDEIEFPSYHLFFKEEIQWSCL